MHTEDNEENEHWSIASSDEELKERNWEPSPQEILCLLGQLERDGVLELQWQCPGRRAPSPAPHELYPEDEESLESKPEEKSDFDFMDELSALKFPPRRGGDPKGSAKKKTTSLDGVLSNMRRHRKLEELEKQGSLHHT